MVDLYKISSEGQIEKTESFPFLDEVTELEPFILKNEKLLGDIALINQQITIPNGGRMDIWGVDSVAKCNLQEL